MLSMDVDGGVMKDIDITYDDAPRSKRENEVQGFKQLQGTLVSVTVEEETCRHFTSREPTGMSQKDKGVDGDDEKSVAKPQPEETASVPAYL